MKVRLGLLFKDQKFKQTKFRNSLMMVIALITLLSFHLFIRKEFFQFKILLSDDLNFVPFAINSDFVSFTTTVRGGELIYGSWFLIFNAFRNVFVLRFFYLGCLLISFLLFDRLISHTFPKEPTIRLAGFLSFFLPSFYVVASEVVGSHTLLSFLVWLIAFNFAQQFDQKMFTSRVLILIVSGLCSLYVGTSSVLLFLLLPLSLHTSFKRSLLEPRVIYTFVGILLFQICFYLRGSALGLYDGFTNSNIQHYLLQTGVIYKAYTDLFFYGSYVISAIVVAMIICAFVVGLRVDRKPALFFLLGFFFTQLPYVKINYLTPRHLVLPPIFIFTFFFYFAFHRLQTRIFMVMLVVIYLATSARVPFKVFYEQTVRVAKHVARLVESEKNSWKEKSQIIIEADPFCRFLTDGYMHWSTGLVRTLAPEKYVFAAIGSKKHLVRNPFVTNPDSANYFFEKIDHNGVRRRRRKPMYGLDRGLPIFAYRLDTRNGHYRRLSDILIKEGDTVIESLHLAFKPSNAMSAEPLVFKVKYQD